MFWAKGKSARSLRLLSVASVWGGGGGVIHIIFLQRNPSLLPEQVWLHGPGLGVATRTRVAAGREQSLQVWKEGKQVFLEGLRGG